MQDLIALAMELNAEDYTIHIEYYGGCRNCLSVYIYRGGYDSCSTPSDHYECDTQQAACDWLRKDHEQFRKGKS